MKENEGLVSNIILEEISEKSVSNFSFLKIGQRCNGFDGSRKRRFFKIRV